MIAELLSGAWVYLAMIGAAIAALFAARQSGKSSERAKAKLKRLKDARATSERIDNAKPADNPDDARANLSDWMRKRK